MKIERSGSTRFHGRTTLLDREVEPIVSGSVVKFGFREVPDPYDSTGRTHHDYSVELTRSDLLEILDKLVLTPALGEDE